MGSRQFAAVTRGNQNAPIRQISQVHIIEPKTGQEGQLPPRQIVNVQARFLISPNDQAFARIGLITPDGRIVRRVRIDRADGHGFYAGGDGNRRVAS